MQKAAKESKAKFPGKQYIVLTDYKGSEEKITIPDQINGIEVKSIQDGFGKNSKLKSITLSKNIASEKDTKRSLAGLNQITTLEEIQTVKDNAAYQSEDGVLYAKDKKELVAYPKSKKSETYVMPSEVEKAGEFAHRVFSRFMFLNLKQPSPQGYSCYSRYSCSF